MANKTAYYTNLKCTKCGTILIRVMDDNGIEPDYVYCELCNKRNERRKNNGKRN